MSGRLQPPLKQNLTLGDANFLFNDTLHITENICLWKLQKRFIISFYDIAKLEKKWYIFWWIENLNMQWTCLFLWQIYPNIVSRGQLFSSFLNFISVYKFLCHTLTTWINHLHAILAVLCTFNCLIVISVGTMRLAYCMYTFVVIGWDHMWKKWRAVEVNFDVLPGNRKDSCDLHNNLWI